MPMRHEALPAPRANGFRDDPTVPAEARTTRWEHAPPWLSGPDAPPRESGVRDDPLFWPAVVFITVFLACIAFFVLARPATRHTGSAELLTSP